MSRNATQRRRSAMLAMVAAVALVASACATSLAASPDVRVDLTHREQIPEIGAIDPKPIRLAVAAVLSPEGNLKTYTELRDYLTDELGRPVELVQRKTYAEINQLIARGDVDLAFVCTSAYVQGHEDGYLDLLVAPELDGETVYHSAIIVGSGDEARSIADLEGKSFAFTDPMSLTGRAYASSLVAELGRDPEEFFDEIIFTYSHDRAVRAVASGLVAGAGVDDIVLRRMLDEEPALRDRIRVMQLSEDFGIPPVVVPADTSSAVRDAFARALLSLDSDPGEREILRSIGVDRFVEISDDAYEGVRSLLSKQRTP